MSHLLKSYLDYLSSNPGEFTSLLLWLISMAAAYTILIVYRKKMIHGAQGENGYWEQAEQVLYIINWVWPPIVCYAMYFRDAHWVQYFLFGVIAWALGGRWLFEWGLQFFRGRSLEPTPIVKTTTDKKVETKEESTSTKIEPK